METRTRGSPRLFLATAVLTILGGLALLTAGHFWLFRAGLLPPPPLTATTCIDERFESLRQAPPAEARLIAIGSSAAWRNLDLRILERAGYSPARNLATCYLHIDQTAFFTEFLLPRAPAVKDVLLVLHPRDFETCPRSERAFFDPTLASLVLDRRLPSWLLYATGISPVHVLASAMEAVDGPRLETTTDGRGSEILTRPVSWRPSLRIDPLCMQGLQALKRSVSGSGVRLTIVLAPLPATWRSSVDPDGAILKTLFAAIIETAASETHLIDLSSEPFKEEEFADPVHLLPDGVARLTHLIAARMGAPA